MPLLNLDPCNTLRNLIRDFKRETGLNLVVLDGREPANASMTIRELWKKRHKPRYGRYFTRNSMVIFPGNLVAFDYRDSIADIREILGEQSKLMVKIKTPDNRDISGRISLREALPSKFKIPVIDWGKIKALNYRVAGIGGDVITQCESIIPSMDYRLKHKADWLKDYEIEVHLDYYLDEDDPLYYPDFDNIVLRQSMPVFGDFYGELLDDGNNYNEWEPFDKKDRQHHCILFHDLCDHHSLPREDVQRIGSVSVDIQVWHQHNYIVKKRK